ncbi:MAG: insulinase family protein [Blastocatellales bacterium]|nr:insulinase family protein [Blastocatellales bacterium]
MMKNPGIPRNFSARFRRSAAAVVILLLVAAAVAAKPSWKQIKLKNGLEVIVIENNSVPLVTVEIAVRNGSYTEPPEYNGLSHLYEHMFFKSIDRTKAKSDNEVLGELGVLSNAQTREEVVNYYTTTMKSGLRETMAYMRDAIRFPLFDKTELEQEREVVLDELSRHQSNPFYYLIRAVDERLWYKYPSRKNVGGSPQIVGSATQEQMRMIQSKFYIPNNSALVISGDVDAAEIFRLAEELFGDWPAAPDPFVKEPFVRHPVLTKDDAVIVNQPVQSVTMQISYHGPSTDIDTPATYTADVFSFILNQPDSRFTRALVDSGLMTNAAINYYTQRNVGPISIGGQTSPDKVKAAIAAINAEIEKFTSPDYITDEQLESAKTLLEVNEIYDREKPSEYAHTVSFWWASSGLDYYAKYVEMVKAVTRADIKCYVDKYIRNRPRVVAVMISAEEQARVGLKESDLLVRNGAVTPLKVAPACPVLGKPAARPAPARRPAAPRTRTAKSDHETLGHITGYARALACGL